MKKMENKKENGIFIPYKNTDDYEVSYKIDLNSSINLLENTQLVQASIIENLNPLIKKIIEMSFIKGLRVGNACDDMEESEELINEEYEKLIKSIYK